MARLLSRLHCSCNEKAFYFHYVDTDPKFLSSLYYKEAYA